MNHVPRHWNASIFGAIKIGLSWALVWMPLGLLTGMIVDSDGAMDEPWLLVGTFPGFLCGVMFFGLCKGAITNKLSLTGAGLRGGLGGLLVGSLPFSLGTSNPQFDPWFLVLVITLPITALSALSAMTTAAWFR